MQAKLVVSGTQPHFAEVYWSPLKLLSFINLHRNVDFLLTHYLFGSIVIILFCLHFPAWQQQWISFPFYSSEYLITKPATSINWWHCINTIRTDHDNTNTALIKAFNCVALYNKTEHGWLLHLMTWYPLPLLHPIIDYSLLSWGRGDKIGWDFIDSHGGIYILEMLSDWLNIR